MVSLRRGPQHIRCCQCGHRFENQPVGRRGTANHPNRITYLLLFWDTRSSSRATDIVPRNRELNPLDRAKGLGSRLPDGQAVHAFRPSAAVLQLFVVLKGTACLFVAPQHDHDTNEVQQRRWQQKDPAKPRERRYRQNVRYVGKQVREAYAGDDSQPFRPLPPAPQRDGLGDRTRPTVRPTGAAARPPALRERNNGKAGTTDRGRPTPARK